MTGGDGQPAPYTYPDPGEKLTLGTIVATGLSMARWEQQEAQILSTFRGELAMLTPRRSLLDLGSGEGRLTLLFADLFTRVVSVEPDEQRAATQVSRLTASRLADRVEVLQSIDGAGSPPFDAALCSHVIQHVPTAVAADILVRLSRSLRPGGYLLLLTTLGGWRSSRFVVSGFDASGNVDERRVTREEFDAAAGASHVGQLPIHFWSYLDLVEALNLRGFSISWSYGFHGANGVVGPLPAPSDGASAPTDLSASRDVAVFAQKAP